MLTVTGVDMQVVVMMWIVTAMLSAVTVMMLAVIIVRLTVTMATVSAVKNKLANAYCK